MTKGFGTGWAYFVPDQPYHDFVSALPDQSEVFQEQSQVGYAGLTYTLDLKLQSPHRGQSSEFKAIKRSSHNRGRGHCMRKARPISTKRHGRPTKRRTVIPCASSKSENATDSTPSVYRFGNMDFICFSALAPTILLLIVISYDVACQWSRNLWARHRSLPAHIQLNTERTCVKTVVPKMHLAGHAKKCYSKNSLNVLPGAARTDGEEIERRWAQTNRFSASTKEMTSGGRKDTIDDICGDLNYRKVIDLGMFG